jgi:uroporphyrinogen decarboxylase
MTELKNDILIRALLRQPTDRTPVWIMRQAGRYLPEYLEIRQQAGSFMKLCKNPELACEVTLQPLRRFALDGAIIFSDILTIPDVMGLGLYFAEGEGPKFEDPIDTESEIINLPRPDVNESLRYVMDAIRLTRRELDGKVPLIGFSGSPWTLAAYMLEGGSSKEFATAKAMIYDEPKLLHTLLGKLAETVTDYLNAQVEAGAQVLQIFDSWGGILSSDAYREYSLRYIEQIVSGLKRENEGRQVPVIVFSKGSNTHLEAIADTGCSALGVDWTITLQEARRRVGDRVALQGNLDPAIMLCKPDVVRQQVSNTLNSYGQGDGHVFNLGHGITPNVDPANVDVLIKAVWEMSPAFH